MLSAADNELLTRTGADTPMGTFFRRFWVPVLLSQELPEPDGPPVRVTVMGDDFVAFRDTEGRVGLLDPRCPHRGASLFFGRNEECGLRCVYHGWKFDVDGRCVDMPTVLGPTDLAIVRFRRMMLEGARGLLAGAEPAAAADGAAYRVRSGSAVARRDVAFADVMTARFGHPLGRIPDPEVPGLVPSPEHAGPVPSRGEP